MWLIAISLYSLRIFDYAPLISHTVLLIVLSIGGFCLGALTYAFAYRRRKKHKMPPMLPLSHEALKNIILFMSLFSISTSVWFLYRMISLFGIEILVIDALAIRHSIFTDLDVAGGMTGLPGQFLVGIIYVSAGLGGIYVNAISSKSIIGYLPFISVVIFNTAYLGRTDIYAVVGIYLFAYILCSNIKFIKHKYGTAIVADGHVVTKKSMITLFVLVSLSLLLFIVLGNLLGKIEGDNANQRIVAIPSPIAHLSNRVGPGSIASLNYYLSTVSGNEELYWGRSSFYPIDILLYNAGLTRKRVVTSYDEYANIPTSGNVYTSLRFFYEDFGNVGVFLCSLIFSFCVTSLYFSFYSRPSFIKYNILLLLYMQIQFITAEVRFINLSIWFAVLFALLTGYILDRVSRKNLGNLLRLESVFALSKK